MKISSGIVLLIVFLFYFSEIKFTKANSYIGQPELSDYNFPGAVICEKGSLKVKFDCGGMNPGNVITAEIAQNGNFNGGQIIQLIGSYAISNGGNNLYYSYTFPLNVNYSGNYRLRLKASNPSLYSNSLNGNDFSITKFQPSDPNVISENYWRGAFYKWTPTISGVIDSITILNQDIFNPANYLGYVTESSLNFDFNWNNSISAPGNLPDSNKVCGAHREAFSIRLRRRINFESGYYKFSIGGDDGFRLSINGGLTWLLSKWNDQVFTELLTNQGCGILMEAGPKDVVVEYFDHTDLARLRVNIFKNGPSASFTGLQPSYCSTAGLVTLVPQAAGGTFSGPNVNGNKFNPQGLESGFYTIKHVITNTDGCIDSSKVQVQIVKPEPAIINLPTSICKGSNPVQLTSNLYGSFSGPGVDTSNFEFDPAAANVGNNLITFTSFQGPCTVTASGNINVFNKIPVSLNLSAPGLCFQQSKKISASFSPAGGTLSGPGLVGDSISANGLSAGDYTIQYIGGTGACADTTKKVFTIYPLPDAGFKKLPDSICVGSPNINLEPNLQGGRFEGQGVTQDRTQFSPQGLIIDNRYFIDYKITDTKGCKNESRDFIYIKSPEKPTLTFPQSKTRFCTYDAAFKPVSNPAGRFFLNGLEVLEIDPSTLKPGDYALKSIYTPLPNNRRCEDSSSAWFRFSIIDHPKPDLGPDFELEKGMALNVKPNIPAPYTWKVDPSFGDFVESSKPITFVPKENVELTVTAYDASNTCYGSDVVKVTLRDAPFFPNLFTPNGDGDNDVWEIKNGYADMEVSIFNRWGKEVYTGKTKGEVAWSGEEAKESGLYFFAITKPDDGRKWNGWLMVSK